MHKFNLVNDLGFVSTGVKEYQGEKNYYSTGSIKEFVNNTEGKYTYKNRPSRANRCVQEGDVLQARMQNTQKAILIDDKYSGSLFSTGFFQLRPPKNLVFSKYLYYCLQTKWFQNLKDSLCSGATQKAINDKKLKEINFFLPSLAEQKRIVTKLDKVFESILKFNEKNNARLEYLNMINVKLNEHVMKKNSKEIKMIPLKELSKKITDGVHKKPNYVEKGIPFLKINNLTEGDGISFKNLSYISIEDHEEFIKRTHPEKDDILITKDGTIGIVRRIETQQVFSIFVSLALIKVNNKDDSEYLTHILASSFCQNQLMPSGAALKHIYLKDLRELIIPFSNKKINLQIVDELNSIEAIIKKIKFKISLSCNNVQKLKSAILKKELQSEAT